MPCVYHADQGNMMTSDMELSNQSELLATLARQDTAFMALLDGWRDQQQEIDIYMVDVAAGSRDRSKLV